MAKLSSDSDSLIRAFLADLREVCVKHNAHIIPLSDGGMIYREGEESLCFVELSAHPILASCRIVEDDWREICVCDSGL